MFVDKKVSMETRNNRVPAGLVSTDRFFAYSESTREFDFWPSGPGLEVPLWLPVLIVASLTAVPWLPCWSKRFSLRTLLIMTTLVAVLLGLIVWAVR
jgi:hypothetical protein